MKKFIIPLFILLASAMSAHAESIVYEGTIGTYKIHMVLDDDYNGYYYYDHRPDSHFKLVKTRESDSDWPCVNVTLQEYAPGSNKNTGEFVGTFCFGQEAGITIISFEGTFRNKSTGKTLPFEVYYVSE